MVYCAAYYIAAEVPLLVCYYLIMFVGRLVQRSVGSQSLVVVEESVAHALASHKPVVALESTILTHGMPYPHNLEYVS